MNSIMQITPYWHNGCWVFDDAIVGLNREPFVLGASEVITKAVEAQNIHKAKKGFNLFFSSMPLPDFHIRLIRDRVSSKTQGTWYTTEDGDRLWLCPSLFLYYSEAPTEIWAICQTRTK